MISNHAIAGSADPNTLAHEALIQSAYDRANEQNWKLNVIISTDKANSSDRTFAIPESVNLVRHSVGHIVDPRSIYSIQESLPIHLQEQNINTLYCGDRSDIDPTYEAVLECFYKNEHLDLDIRQIRLEENLSEISSSAVKEVTKLGHSIEKFVNPHIKAALESRLLGQYSVGITGPTGSGKTHFSKKLQEIGEKNGIEVHHIDYDRLAHEIYSPSITQEPIYEKVRQTLSKTFPGVLDSHGEIDRWRLRQYVFDSEDAASNLSKLNAIMSDIMKFRYRKTIKGKKWILLVDAALLTELDLTILTNHSTVIVSANEELRAQRIASRTKRSGKLLTKEQLQSQMASQAPFQAMNKKAESIVEQAHSGFVFGFDNSECDEKDYENAFFKILSKLDIFGEIRGNWTLSRLGIPKEESEKILLEWRSVYNQSERAYHNWNHVVTLLDAIFDPRFSLDTEERIILSLAAMWHDLVHSTDPKSNPQNEFLSCQETLKRILPHIRHLRFKKLAIEAWEIILDRWDQKLRDFFHDCDYAILGSKQDAYRTYRTDIRREYSSSMPFKEFNQKRKKFLQNLIQQSRPIFRTEAFQKTLESIAWINIQDELNSQNSPTMNYFVTAKNRISD